MPWLNTHWYRILIVLSVVAVGVAWGVRKQAETFITPPSSLASFCDSEIDTSDIDMHDWKEYKSDIYGYRLLLPPEFMFVKEYDNSPHQFDPNNDLQVIARVSDRKYISEDWGWNAQMTITITQLNSQNSSIRDIDEYINLYERESGLHMCFTRKDGEEVRYYVKAGKCECQIPTVIYFNDVVIEFTYNYIQPIYMKKIIESIRFD